MLKKILIFIVAFSIIAGSVLMYFFSKDKQEKNVSVNPLNSSQPKDAIEELNADIKKGYEENFLVLREEKGLKLKAIMLETAEGWQNKIQYAFITEKEMIVVMYDRASKKNRNKYAG